MKKLLILGVIVSSLFANELVVKKADVNISIGSQQLSLKNGEKLSLNEGDTVCYQSGKGRIVINGTKQLSKRTASCYTLPLPEGFDAKHYANEAAELVSVSFIRSKESVQDGASTKSIAGFDNDDLLLKKEAKEFVFISDELGPHPVIVNIKNQKGEVVFSMINEESDITLMKVDAGMIQDGYILNVLDGFNGELMTKKIVKE